MDSKLGLHMIDHFKSALNKSLPRYYANYLDQLCDAEDALQPSDAHWRDENNLCNPPWPLLTELSKNNFKVA
jgi:hypothetical protein